ncbi:MAG: MBL fold metallo-hydrolase, partial [Planctomycetota bacterium]
AHVLVLEFNHDAELLAHGPYTPALKRRVSGPRGHLSNAEASAVLRVAAGPGLHTLVLAHLSATNNRPQLARAAAEATLGELGRQDVRVLVAEQDVPGPNLTV